VEPGRQGKEKGKDGPGSGRGGLSLQTYLKTKKKKNPKRSMGKKNLRPQGGGETGTKRAMDRREKDQHPKKTKKKKQADGQRVMFTKGLPH